MIVSDADSLESVSVLMLPASAAVARSAAAARTFRYRSAGTGHSMSGEQFFEHQKGYIKALECRRCRRLPITDEMPVGRSTEDGEPC